MAALLRVAWNTASWNTALFVQPGRISSPDSLCTHLELNTIPLVSYPGTLAEPALASLQDKELVMAPNMRLFLAALAVAGGP